ncbi:MAG: histidinol-phosphate transaminase [Gemmatimonadetes bacterium]|nr:histidinol-phosphate transaminase [Gemmatimonadota bacterium]
MIRLSDRARTFQPYRAARHDALAGLLLDANEHARGGLREHVDLAETLAGLARYPDPANLRLRRSAAAAYDVPTEAVFTGNGSDEAIDLLFRAFTDPGDEVLVAVPTYGMYAVQAALNAVAVRELPLGADFRLPEGALDGGAAVGSRARLLFACSPNNPTGNLIGRRGILDAARRFPGLTVVDEAYVEFSGAPSLAREAARAGSSLVVLRTLSKAWGLAGLRVGFAIADPAVIAVLQRVKLPYNLNAVASAIGVRVLGDGARLDANVGQVLCERDRLRIELGRRGLAPLPSDANFLLVPHAGATELVQRLASRENVVVRDRSGLREIPSAFRVTVGSGDDNARFLEALDRCLA